MSHFRPTLAAAADYFRTSRAPRFFLAIIASVRRVFSFSQERANRLVRFLRVVKTYSAGHPVDSIAERFGCSRSTVLRYARLAGLDKRPKSDDPERRAKIIALSKEGKFSQKEIAARCNCSVSLVSIVEHEAGLNRYYKKRTA